MGRLLRFWPLVLALSVALVLPAGGQTLGTTFFHGAITCAVTSTAVVVANPSRQGLVVLNNGGGAAIFVGTGNPAALSTANGFPVANGGALSLDEYKGSLNCIVAAGTLELRYAETTR